MGRMNRGVAAALGVGTGAALAASMGPVGYAVGLGLWFGVHGFQRSRGSNG